MMKVMIQPLMDQILFCILDLYFQLFKNKEILLTVNLFRIYIGN